MPVVIHGGGFQDQKPKAGKFAVIVVEKARERVYATTDDYETAHDICGALASDRRFTRSFIMVAREFPTATAEAEGDDDANT